MFRAFVICVLLCVLNTAAALADAIFDLASKPGQRVLLTLSDEPLSPDTLKFPAIEQRDKGVLGELTRPQIAELRATLDRQAPDVLINPRRVCVVHIHGVAGSARVVIEQGEDGRCVARELAEATTAAVGKRGPRTAALKGELLDRLLGDIGYLGSVAADGCNDAKGKVFEVPRPYQHGPAQLDATMVRERLGSGGHFRYEPSKAVLQQETLWARLPRGYDPSKTWGLVVWIDASPSGKPPAPMERALDEQGMVCIGVAASGNDRQPVERLQLALDALNTAKRRWRIDPARVHVAGISGGGKMASMTLMCFPEEFRGALCFVGLATYEDLPTGEGNQRWPGLLAKPSGKRWQKLGTRRIAAVTGNADFNHAPIVATVKQLHRDKLNVKLFDIDGMSHTFPSPEAISEQLRWLDDAAQPPAPAPGGKPAGGPP